MMLDISARVDAVEKIAVEFRSLASILAKHGSGFQDCRSAELTAIEKEYRGLKTSASRKMRIAIAGKFSCGKSQFINSMIGKEIASVDSARTTCCKTIFTSDPQLSEITITDSAGVGYALDEYVQLSARASASRNVFTVRLPGADWEDFEVVDTPGYDSIDEEDRQISEEAVAEADVVFFLFDIGNGTIPKDSIDYLKKFVNTRQLFYLIANKADLKPENARRAILDSIADECNRNEVRYECVLPFSSLMPWSKEIHCKSEKAKANVLELAARLKNNAIEVIERLIQRSQTLSKPRIAACIENADGHLKKWFDDVVQDAFSEINNVLLTEIEHEDGKCISICDQIVSIIQDSAVDYTFKHGSRFVRWHELKGTGIFVCDWAVYLAKATDEYDLEYGDLAELSGKLARVFSGHGIAAARVLLGEIIELRKQCAIRTIDQFRIRDEDAPADDALFFYSEAVDHSDFCHTCDYESERRGNENLILDKLNAVFPGAFAKIAEPVVKNVVNGLTAATGVRDVYASIMEIYDKLSRICCLCAAVMDSMPPNDEGIKSWLEKLGVSLSPAFGTVRYQVRNGQRVSVGDILLRVRRDSGAGDEIVAALRPGMVIALSEDGAAVSLSDPLVAVCPLCGCSKLGITTPGMLCNDASSSCVGRSSQDGGFWETIDSTVDGRIESLLFADGSAVVKDDLLMRIDVLNVMWPVRATQSGRVRYNVWVGKAVRVGDLLAVISTQI